MATMPLIRKEIKGSDVDFPTLTIIDSDYITVTDTDGSLDESYLDSTDYVEVVDAPEQ